MVEVEARREAGGVPLIEQRPVEADVVGPGLGAGAQVLVGGAGMLDVVHVSLLGYPFDAAALFRLLLRRFVSVAG